MGRNRTRRVVAAALALATVAAVVAPPAGARWAKRNAIDFSWVDDIVRACPKGFVYGRATTAADPGVGATGSIGVVAKIAFTAPGSPPEETEVLRANVGLVRNPLTLEVDFEVFETRWLSGAQYFAWKVNGTPVTLPEGTGLQINSGEDLQFATVGDCTQGDLPEINVRGGAMAEGDGANRNMVFNVSLSRRTALPVTVQYTTQNGTATTADNDYVAKSGTLTFPPGERQATILVPVKPDTRVETNQTFRVVFSNQTNALMPTPSATATIRNDDAPSAAAVLHVGDVDCSPGYMATRHCKVPVTLSKPRTAVTTVKFRTVDGTAKTEAPGFDYFAATGTLTFAAGEVQKLITLSVTGNYTETELIERFFVDLHTPSGAAISDSRGVVRIMAI
jgi:Calx-beta domain